MHIVIEALTHLINVPKDQYDTKLKEVEKHINSIDINEIPQSEFEALYKEIISSLEDENIDIVYNALKLLGYTSNIEPLTESHFGDYVQIYTEIMLINHRSLHKPNLQLLEHIEEIFRDYAHRQSVPDEYPDFTKHVYADMQEIMISLLVWLQERETEMEKELEEDSSDRSHDLGVVHSADTSHGQLKYIRKALELLTEGVLEKVLYDEGYELRKSKTDPELEIVGRYEFPVHEHTEGCGCCHH